MRRGRQILAAIILLAVMCACRETTAFATEPDAAEQTEELSEEQKAEQAAYEMKVDSNDWKNWPQGPGTYGEAAIVMEVGTGAILYAKNIDSHQYPASITKVLTALVAMENGQLEDPVTFSHDSVAFLKPGDSSVGLKEGNQISLEQALHATLLASANEAAYAVGESVGINAGHDYNWFMEQMNIRCRELGGENSNFANTNGLHDENHYTCARDMALIAKEALSNETVRKISGTVQYTIPATNAYEARELKNSNYFLSGVDEELNGKQFKIEKYEGVFGGKTGYLYEDQATMVTGLDADGLELYCVVMGSTIEGRYTDIKTLMDYGKANVSKYTAFEQGDSFGKVKLKGGAVNKVEAVAADDGYINLPEGVSASLVTTE